MRKTALGGILVTLALLSACNADGTDSKKFSAALNFSGSATAADVGLPAYPGATLFKERSQSDGGANIDFNTPMFGLKVVAVKFITSDRPEQVAKFYRDALSEYGSVLDCGRDTKVKATAPTSDDLDCELDRPSKTDFVYKVGTAKNQHIVAIKRRGKDTQFDLVHVDMRGESN